MRAKLVTLASNAVTVLKRMKNVSCGNITQLTYVCIVLHAATQISKVPTREIHRDET